MEETLKFVDGVLFVWVPAHPQSKMPGHWLSTVGEHIRVVPDNVFYNVLMHRDGERDPSMDNKIGTAGFALEDKAFKQAVTWALRGCS